MDKYLSEIKRAAKILSRYYYDKTEQEIQSEICCLWDKIQANFNDKYSPEQTIMMVWRSQEISQIRQKQKRKGIKVFSLDTPIPDEEGNDPALMCPDEIPELLEKLNNKDILEYIRKKYPEELDYILKWYSLNEEERYAQKMYWVSFRLRLEKIKKHCEKLIKEYNE